MVVPEQEELLVLLRFKLYFVVFRVMRAQPVLDELVMDGK